MSNQFGDGTPPLPLGGVGAASRSGLRLRARKDTPVMVSTKALSNRRSRPAEASSGSPKSCGNSLSARLLVISVAPRS